MSDHLYRLVYFSRNLLPGSADDVADGIRCILQSSQHNNRLAGVTGALMFNKGCFAQVLEGPRDGVEAVFERIQQDERHGDVTLLSFGPVTRRGFPNWSMAFVGDDADDAGRFGSIAEISGFEPARMTGEQIYAVLKRQLFDEEAIPA